MNRHPPPNKTTSPNSAQCVEERREALVTSVRNGCALCTKQSMFVVLTAFSETLLIFEFRLHLHVFVKRPLHVIFVKKIENSYLKLIMIFL